MRIIPPITEKTIMRIVLVLNPPFLSSGALDSSFNMTLKGGTL